MEQGDELMLRIAIEIDQQIAAGEQIEVAERRIYQQLCGANTTFSRISLTIW